LKIWWKETLKKILKNLGLWDLKSKPAPKATEYIIDYSVSQLPCMPDAALNLRCSYCALAKADEEDGSDNWFYVDPEYQEAFAF
jgi:hypothetical protein